MATFDFNALMAQAEAEGFSNEILPDGPYEMEVAAAKAGSSQGGKGQIGIRLKVVAGPLANKSTWDNLTLSPESAKALAVFFRKIGQYGVSPEFIRASNSMEAIAGAVPVGARYMVDLGHREWNGKTYQQVNSVKPLAAAGVAPVAAPAAPVAPVAPVAPAAAPAPAPAAPAPAPAQPAPVPQPAQLPQPAPVPQPAAIPQPAPVEQPAAVAPQPVAPTPSF